MEWERLSLFSSSHDIMISILCLIGGCFMNNMCWSCFISISSICCILLFPHVWSVSTLCSSRGFLIFFSLFPQGCHMYFLLSIDIYSYISKLKAVDSKLFSFLFFIFIFLFKLSSFLFLELWLGWLEYVVTHQSHQMTWSQVTSYIEGHRRF